MYIWNTKSNIQATLSLPLFAQLPVCSTVLLCQLIYSALSKPLHRRRLSLPLALCCLALSELEGDTEPWVGSGQESIGGYGDYDGNAGHYGDSIDLSLPMAQYHQTLPEGDGELEMLHLHWRSTFENIEFLIPGEDHAVPGGATLQQVRHSTARHQCRVSAKTLDIGTISHFHRH